LRTETLKIKPETVFPQTHK